MFKHISCLKHILIVYFFEINFKGLNFYSDFLLLYINNNGGVLGRNLVGHVREVLMKKIYMNVLKYLGCDRAL